MDYERYPPIIFADDFDQRSNIAWRVEPAKDRQVLLEPRYPWDSASTCTGHGTVLRDPIDGRWKGWFVAVQENLNHARGKHDFRLVHVVSEDGRQWTRPELDLCPFEGYPRTNILFDYESGGRTTYASVFVDPEAHPEEPYEMFCLRDARWKCPSGRVAGFGAVAGYGLYRYRSRDGIHWRPDHGPIGISSGDTLQVHKDPDGSYVSHHKDSIPNYPGGWAPYDVDPRGCRVSFQCRSGDGRVWTPSALNMVPDWLDSQGDQIMEVGRQPYGDGFIGLTAVYHSRLQEMDLQFGASASGEPLSWWRPARRPCLPLAPLGDYGGGMLWPTRTLVEDGDDLVLFYGALEGLHGDTYSVDETAYLFHGAFCRASWRKGRMWAAVSAAGGAHEGVLTTKPLADVRGRELVINAVTKPGGQVTCELLRDGRPLEGYGREDCTPVAGDHTCAPIRWAGGARCPAANVALRLTVRGAYLYGYAWR